MPITSSTKKYINAYKKHNFKAKSLSPQLRQPTHHLTTLIEKLTPFLIIATTFVWLWK